MTGRKTIDLAIPFVTNPAGGNPQSLNWVPSVGATAADIAAILYQKPVMVAWHARQMLERGKVDPWLTFARSRSRWLRRVLRARRPPLRRGPCPFALQPRRLAAPRSRAP